MNKHFARPAARPANSMPATALAVGDAAEPARAEPGDAVASAGLAALYAFTVVALAGYAVFGVDPSRLMLLPPWAAAFYGHAFGFFAIAQVWLAAGVLAAVLVRRAGAQWLPAFGVMYAISLGSELAGTTWGVPFGDYAYSPLLGTMWLDRVPVVIPLSWFFMAVPSYALAVLAVPGRAARIGVASLILLAWDLALDPAMSYATRYWVWGDSGPYYGMPWLNLFGWYVTGLVLMGVLSWQRAERWTSRVPPRWWVGFYGANLLMPLGMCVAAGLWLATGATLAVLALLWLLLAARARVAT